MRADRRRSPNHVEAAVKKPALFSAEGAVSCKSATGRIRRGEPGASPQELEWPGQRALKARRQRGDELNRAFSARFLSTMNPRALPQAADDHAPLALTRCKGTPLLALVTLVLANTRDVRVLVCLGSVALAFRVAAQTAVDVARPEERQKARQTVVKEQEKLAKRTSSIEFRGQQAFDEKELRVALKEEIATIEQFGLSPARADDLAFFLEVFYRKHGYAKVNVHYVIESKNRVRLDITEGPLMTLSKVIFDGNTKESADKLFEYVVGPTRERYSRLEKRLPFVAADLEEGTHLVQRFCVAEGFLDSVLDRPRPSFVVKRFSNLGGKTYSPDVLDERFRTLMKTGLFNLVQIKPVPFD